MKGSDSGRGREMAGLEVLQNGRRTAHMEWAWDFGLWSWGLVAGLVLRDKAHAIGSMD